MTIEEFVCRYFSLQQTALVDNMLYEDKHLDMLNSLYNYHMHTVELSSGRFIGTHSQLMIKKAAINKILQQRSNEALLEDVERLEGNSGDERTVYEWFAIPYWIARYMIDSDEVVLSWKDCYWWGRCAVHQSVLFDTCIRELYQCSYLPE